MCVDESRAPLLCEDEKPAISPSLRVRIIPLKTSQILAPCSATLGLTTGGNYYTFCFLFSHQTAPRPGREHTHAVHNTSPRFDHYIPLTLSSCGKNMQAISRLMGNALADHAALRPYRMYSKAELCQNGATCRHLMEISSPDDSDFIFVGVFLFCFLLAN